MKAVEREPQREPEPTSEEQREAIRRHLLAQHLEARSQEIREGRLELLVKLILVATAIGGLYVVVQLFS
ncbi:hypothetical protein [Microbacterium sp. KR10-403]|uniref:hypothetical protein n=1 Tax=Microbacterium sp. KR10-403 TaxID=3158581 RepID=UPI0032E36CC7